MASFNQARKGKRGFFVDARTKEIALQKARKFLKPQGLVVTDVKPTKYTARWLIKYRKRK